MGVFGILSEHGQTNVVCKLCKTIVPTKTGNTTNWFYHLSRSHPVELSRIRQQRSTTPVPANTTPQKQQTTFITCPPQFYSTSFYEFFKYLQHFFNNHLFCTKLAIKKIYLKIVLRYQVSGFFMFTYNNANVFAAHVFEHFIIDNCFQCDVSFHSDICLYLFEFSMVVLTFLFPVCLQSGEG